jgi:hypothetical protein
MVDTYLLENLLRMFTVNPIVEYITSNVTDIRWHKMSNVTQCEIVES